MSLIVSVTVNGHPTIGRATITRAPGGPDGPDALHTYWYAVCQGTGRGLHEVASGQLQHREGDGPWALVAAVCADADLDVAVAS